MNPDKTALVLGGGGSRGAYEIGVWRALKELGIGFSIVTGTSVGALNGAIIAQGDYDTAVRVWSSITNETVLNLDVPLEKPFDEAGLRERLEFLGTFAREIAVQGGADTSPLKKLLEDVLDERAIRASDVRFGLVTVRLPDMRPKAVYLSELPEGTLVDYVLASASCFPAMQSHKIDGKAYIDGGYFDNLPIELAIQGGAEAVIAVDIKGLGRHRKADGIDPEKLRIITTPWNLGSMLVFDADTARRNMELGYLDTMKSWGRLQGTLYAFDSDPKTAFEPLFTKALTLFSQIYPDSGTTGALHRLTKLRLLRHLYSLYRGMPNAPVPMELRGDDSTHILPMAFAENAGKVFGLDPTVVYSPEAFTAALETAFASVQPLDFGKAESLFSEWKPISDFASDVAEKLGGITPLRIAKSIYEYLMNHRNVPVHWTTALPAEFMAALAMMSVRE